MSPSITRISIVAIALLSTHCTGQVSDPVGGSPDDPKLDLVPGTEGSGDHGMPFVPAAERAPTTGDDASADPDTGSLASDSGAIADDTGSAPEDTASAPVDTGSAPLDTGSAPLDTGSAPLDTGSAPLDTGTAAVDTGTAAVDTGTAAVDTGTAAVDTGTVAPVDAAPAPAVTPASHVDAIVAEITRELSVKKSSTYTHTTFVDEATGTFDYDCSGFIGYALDHAYPVGIDAIRAATEARPLAKDFETFFSTPKSGWTRVGRALDLRAGDIVAWLQPADLPSTNTGHVMFVRGTPTANAARNEILVPITDSTSSPHGAGDSRTASGATGLGTGTIGLVVDSAGAPTAFYWTGGASTTSHATSIALGHAL